MKRGQPFPRAGAPLRMLRREGQRSLDDLRAGSARTLAELRAASNTLARPGLLYTALATVLLSLLALIVVPVLVQREMDGMHDDLDRAIDPAARNVDELRYYLAREMALARGFVLSGDSSMLLALYAMRDSATALSRQFPQGTRSLSSDVAEDLGAAAAYVEAWHRALEPAALEPLPAPPPEQPFGRGAYGDALSGLDSLRASLGVSAAARRARVRELERLQIQTTVGLGVLALLSAALVAWLVSRVRRLAQEAERQRAESQRAARTRERLIRGISHDLKNPLSVIDGYAELLAMGLRGPILDEQKQTLERIRATVASLLSTVNELVDLSSAQAGLLRIEREPVAVGPLLRELVTDYESVAEGAGLRLQLAELPDVETVHGDRRRIRQILENLLGNAIKYTGPGGLVLVSGEVVERGSQHGTRWLGVHVEDTGPGIPPERMDAVFDEFVRLANAAGTSGSGIGLTMARSLARAMGGDIEVVSQVGVGSVFTLWLPLGRD